MPIISVEIMKTINEREMQTTTTTTTTNKGREEQWEQKLQRKGES